MDYYLTFLPQDDYYIFQALRLQYEIWTFQIDFLLLTTRFALIIEAKNLGGKLNFENKFHQLIQLYHEKEKVYDDPTAQAERQRRLLSRWLAQYLPVPLPIECLVAMSNTNAILTTDSHDIPKRVCKPFKLLDKIERIEHFYSKETIDRKTVKKLSKLLLQHHTPKSFNILSEYQIPQKDILTGVRCPTCKNLPMIYQYGKWHCKLCGTSSKDAHLASLNDYFSFLNLGSQMQNSKSFSICLPTISHRNCFSN